MNIFSHKELVPAAPAGNGQVEQTANPYLDARRQSNSQIDRAFGSLTCLAVDRCRVSLDRVSLRCRDYLLWQSNQICPVRDRGG